MPHLPIISGKKLLNILKKHGFSVLRRKGSHVFVENEDATVRTVIPVHGNEDLWKGILKSILNDLEIEVREIQKWVKR